MASVATEISSKLNTDECRKQHTCPQVIDEKREREIEHSIIEDQDGDDGMMKMRLMSFVRSKSPRLQVSSSIFNWKKGGLNCIELSLQVPTSGSPFSAFLQRPTCPAWESRQDTAIEVHMSTTQIMH
jgi:hypothetical protein